MVPFTKNPKPRTSWKSLQSVFKMLTEVLVGVALVVLVLRYLTQKKYNLPPGPRGLPFIGNVFQMDKNASHDTMIEWSEEYGDVFKIKMFGDDFVVLNSFETIYEALVTKANEFAGRPSSFRIKFLLKFCDDVIFTTFSRKWIFLKKLTMQSLKMYGDNLENLEVISLDLIHDLIKELKEEAQKGPLDMKPHLLQCVTGIITSILYGTKPSRQNVDSLHREIEESSSVIEPTGSGMILDIFPMTRYLPNKTFSKLLEIRALTEHWFNKEINDRKLKHEPGNPQCFLDALFEHQRRCKENKEEFQLLDTDIYGINLDMIFAGTVTTSITLHSLIALLVNKPELQKQMASEIFDVLGDRVPTLNDRQSLPYIEAAILELLRYTTILPLNLPHYTTEDTNINGYDIPKDTRVMFNLWKLHHNPEYWDEPWEFKPERYLDEDGKVVAADHINRKRLMAFGASRRVCAGETLAKNRLFLMITSLIQHFEFLPAGPDELPSHDPRTFDTGINVMPKRFRTKLVPRK